MEINEQTPEESSSFLLKAYDSFVPGFVRKAVLLGLGGVSLTEEGIRRILGDVRLPREEARRLFDFVVQQSQRTKADFLSLASSELKIFLKTLNFEQELRQVLAGMRVKIQAEITFEELGAESDGPQVDFQTTVRHDTGQS